MNPTVHLRYSESPSSCAMHDQCAQKYKYKYIEKLPDPVGPAAEFGKAFEEVVFPRWNDRGDTIHPDEKISRMLRALFNSQEIAGLSNAKAFQVKIDVPCGQTRLFGYLDMHLEDDSIIDLKTSGKPWDDAKFNASEQHIAYPFGMIRMGMIPKKFPIIFKYVIVTTTVNPQVQILTAKISEEALVKYERKFNDRLEKIKLETELNMFPTNRGSHCHYCPYRNLCPAWK